MTASYTGDEDDSEAGHFVSKSSIKRECHHLLDVGEKLLQLSSEELRSMDLTAELEEAVNIAQKIKSRSGLKRQRQYIGKLLRSVDNKSIEEKIQKIRHRHDTNTAQFKKLEKWRDSLIENDGDTLHEIIARFPDIDRQHINQLIRSANQEKQRNKPPAAARKLFKYLRSLEEQHFAANERDTGLQT